MNQQICKSIRPAVDPWQSPFTATTTPLETFQAMTSFCCSFMFLYSLQYLTITQDFLIFSYIGLKIQTYKRSKLSYPCFLCVKMKGHMQMPNVRCLNNKH